MPVYLLSGSGNIKSRTQAKSSAYDPIKVRSVRKMAPKPSNSSTVRPSSSTIYALLRKLQHAEGGPTKHGRWAIAVAIVAGSVSIVLGTLEHAREKKETTEKANQSLAILNEIQRGLHPIQDVESEYWIGVPSDDIHQRPYLHRFSRGLQTITNTLTTKRPEWIRSLLTDPGGNAISFEFDSSCDLAPSQTREAFGYQAFASTDIEFQVYRKPLDPRFHPARSLASTNRPDLFMRTFTWLPRKDSVADSEYHYISYDLRRNQFVLHAKHAKSPARNWEATGAIVSVPDLLGSQIFIALPSKNITGNEEMDRNIREIRKRFHLEKLILHISTGRDLWIYEKDLIKLADQNGFPLYVLTFPDTPNEFNKMTVNRGEGPW